MQTQGSDSRVDWSEGHFESEWKLESVLARRQGIFLCSTDILVRNGTDGQQVEGTYDVDLDRRHTPEVVRSNVRVRRRTEGAVGIRVRVGHTRRVFELGAEIRLVREEREGVWLDGLIHVGNMSSVCSERVPWSVVACSSGREGYYLDLYCCATRASCGSSVDLFRATSPPTVSMSFCFC